VGSDWPRLAQELNISNKEVDRIQADGQNEQKQSLSMLKLWMKQAGVLATGDCCIVLNLYSHLPTYCTSVHSVTRLNTY